MDGRRRDRRDPRRERYAPRRTRHGREHSTELRSTVEDEAIDAGRAGADTADGEGAELRALQGRVSVRAYVDNVMGNFRSSTPRSLHVTAGAENGVQSGAQSRT